MLLLLQNPGGKSSRIIKQTTTTYRPGFDKVVFSSVTRNIVPPQQQEDSAKLQRAYHSTHNVNYNDEAIVARGATGSNLNKAYSATSLANGHFETYAGQTSGDRTFAERHVPVRQVDASNSFHHEVHSRRSKEPENFNGYDDDEASVGRKRDLNKAYSATSLTNGHFERCAGQASGDQTFAERQVPVRRVDSPRAVHHRIHEMRGGRSKEREKSHFHHSQHQTKERDYYVRESSAHHTERRTRPAERHVQKYERVQSAPNYTTAVENHHVRTVPIQEQRVYTASQSKRQRQAADAGQGSHAAPSSPQPERKPRRLLPEVEGRARVHRSESTKT